MTRLNRLGIRSVFVLTMAAAFVAFPTCLADPGSPDAVQKLKHLFICMSDGSALVCDDDPHGATDGAPLVQPGEAARALVLNPPGKSKPRNAFAAPPDGNFSPRGTGLQTRPASPKLRVANTLRLYMVPSGSSYQVSERGDLTMSIRSINVGLLVEALKRESGAGDGRRPVRIEERYAEYLRPLGSGENELGIRLGTRSNMGFGNGLTAGSLNLDGISGSTTLSGARVLAFWGAARNILPQIEETFKDDFTTRPVVRESQEGISVGGAHLEYDNRKNLSIGVSALRSQLEKGGPGILFVGADGSLMLGRLNLEGEATASRDGGAGSYFKASFSPHRFTSLGLGMRDYRHLRNRVNLPPLYSGISGGNDTNEIGWFASADVTPRDWLSAGVAVDSSKRHDGSQPKNDTLVSVQVNPTRRLTTMLTWERERAPERNPRIITAMGSYRLNEGGRASIRYSQDFDGLNRAKLVHLSAQVPVYSRRLTLIGEHAMRTAEGSWKHSPQIGCTLRLWNGNFLTFRYGFMPGEADNLSTTLFSRY